jgi:hypothetical protein
VISIATTLVVDEAIRARNTHLHERGWRITATLDEGVKIFKLHQEARHMKSLSREPIELKQRITTETTAAVGANHEIRDLTPVEINAVAGSGGPVLKIPTDPC